MKQAILLLSCMLLLGSHLGGDVAHDFGGSFSHVMTPCSPIVMPCRANSAEMILAAGLFLLPNVPAYQPAWMARRP